MTKEELAAKLHNSQYPFFLQPELKEEAKRSNLVVVCGQSDDIMALYGTISDETYIYGDGSVLFYSGGILCNRDELDTDEDVSMWLKQKKESKEIKAFFDKKGYSWIYETDIPHATFDIIEDNEKYCKAMVIDLNNI